MNIRSVPATLIAGFLAISTVSCLLSACESNERNGNVGPCVHLYQDEVLHIDTASGTATGAVIAQVDLHSFFIDSDVVTIAAIAQGRTANVEEVGDILRCTLPCSFGTESGFWEFTALASGYVSTDQGVAASYATFEGGCPSFEDGGTHVTIDLNEAGS